METDHLRAAFCTAELVRTRTDLDYPIRSLIISLAPPFDTRSSVAVTAGVTAAFRNAGVSCARRRYSDSRIEGARRTAEEWIDRGIFLLSRNDMANSETDRHYLPPILFARGTRSILERPAVSILNSRTSRGITPTDTWLSASKILFDQAAAARPAFLSSYGTVPYAVVSRLASINGFALIMICEDILPFMKPCRRLEEFIGTCGDLFHPERTLFLSPYPPGRLPPRRVRSMERDCLVATLSSVIMAAAVRQGGTMEAAIRRAAKTKTNITVFRPEHPERSTAGNIAIVRDHPNRPIRTVTAGARSLPATTKDDRVNRTLITERAVLTLRSWPVKGSCLIHYTRACHGPWPGQTIGAYCQSLLDNSRGSAHSGFDTLVRILTQGVICATHRLTRGPVPVVSLTECLPDELQALIKWRRGLIRWSFEPYGIALQKKPLLALGAKPVIYGEEKTFEDLTDDQKHLFQIRKKTGPDWSLEREWRLPGDFTLESVPRDAITIIVASLTEARAIHHRFGYEVTLAGITTNVSSNDLYSL